MINKTYFPEELANLGNARSKAVDVKYKSGDAFEKFIEDNFERTLGILEDYSADYGLHVNGQINNEYDIIVYKNGSPTQVQSVFELKDRDLEGIFSIYHKYVSFIVHNKGRVYEIKGNGGEVVYPRNIEYFGLINLSMTEGNIYALLSEYSSIILNQMFEHVGKNFKKLLEVTVGDVSREKNNVDSALDEIKYYFVSIGQELPNKKQPKSIKLIRKIKNETNNINYNNVPRNIGFHLIEELSKSEGVEVVNGKRVIEGIKNNCVLINKDTSELNRDHIDIFILMKILSKENLEKALDDKFFSHSVKQISLNLMSALIKVDHKKISDNLVKLSKELEREKGQIIERKSRLEKTLNKLSNTKKPKLQETINKLNIRLQSIPTSKNIYDNLKRRREQVVKKLSEIYGVDVFNLLKERSGITRNGKFMNLNEFEHYLPPPNLNTMRGGKKTVHIKGVGNRKVRYYKNGNPYVIVGGKKKKLRK